MRLGPPASGEVLGGVPVAWGLPLLSFSPINRYPFPEAGRNKNLIIYHVRFAHSPPRTRGHVLWCSLMSTPTLLIA